MKARWRPVIRPRADPNKPKETVAAPVIVIARAPRIYINIITIECAIV